MVIWADSAFLWLKYYAQSCNLAVFDSKWLVRNRTFVFILNNFLDVQEFLAESAARTGIVYSI